MLALNLEKRTIINLGLLGTVLFCTSHQLTAQVNIRGISYRGRGNPTSQIRINRSERRPIQPTMKRRTEILPLRKATFRTYKPSAASYRYSSRV